jgi:hypothetical protein
MKLSQKWPMSSLKMKLECFDPLWPLVQIWLDMQQII